MEIHSESRIHWPRDRVFLAYRDRLPELAPYLPDVSEIIVRSREDDGEVVRLHNEWASTTEIPRVARAVIRPEHLRWDDHAVWHLDGYYCAWRIETRVFTQQFRCQGRNTFLEDGDGTVVALTGELTIDLATVPGVPRFVGRKLAPQVEKFIVSLITPNLVKTNESLERFLDDQEG